MSRIRVTLVMAGLVVAFATLALTRALSSNRVVVRGGGGRRARSTWWSRRRGLRRPGLLGGFGGPAEPGDAGQQRGRPDRAQADRPPESTRQEGRRTIRTRRRRRGLPEPAASRPTPPRPRRSSRPRLRRPPDSKSILRSMRVERRSRQSPGLGPESARRPAANLRRTGTQQPRGPAASAPGPGPAQERLVQQQGRMMMTAAMNELQQMSERGPAAESLTRIRSSG